MHILYIYSEISIMGGTDKVLVDKANYLATHGYQVTIVTEAQMGRKLSFPLDPAVKHIDMGLDFNKQYQSGFLNRICIYYSLRNKYKKRLRKVLIEEKPDIVSVIVGRSLDFIADIHDGSIKIVEAHTTKHFLRSYHLMEQRGGIFKYLAQYLRWNMCRQVSRLDGIVLLTQRDADDWKEAKRTFVIPNAVPYYPKESSTLDNKQVIMVGRYNDAKGYDYLIPAWETVHLRHPDWVLNVYGSGELHDQVVKWVESVIWKILSSCMNRRVISRRNTWKVLSVCLVLVMKGFLWSFSKLWPVAYLLCLSIVRMVLAILFVMVRMVCWWNI